MKVTAGVMLFDEDDDGLVKEARLGIFLLYGNFPRQGFLFEKAAARVTFHRRR